jgi:hypothetical protein
MGNLTERQQEVYDTYNQCLCSEARTIEKLGINRTTLRKNLFFCARKGYPISPDTFCEHAPAGFGLTKSTIQYNANGIVQQWDRIAPEAQSIDQFCKYLEDRTPVLKTAIPPPKDFDRDLMLEWKLFDQHHTLHAWGKQTGADYTIKHSQHLIESAAATIYREHGPVDTSVIVLGGDNFHTDNRSNITEKSKHHLDVDSRYQKGIETFYVSIVTAIDMALLKSQNVVVQVLSGNHDYHSSIALALILQAHYKDIGRVTINTSPAKHKFFRWGESYFMYTHGDTGPPKRLASYIMQHIIKNDITGVRRVYVRRGHVHKKGKESPPGLTQEDGVIIETYDALVAPDNFSAESAYSQTRATTTDIFHKQWGRRGGMDLTADELMLTF